MFLSFSYPEINKSPVNDTGQHGEGSSTESPLTEPSISLSVDHHNYNYDGDRSDSDLSMKQHFHFHTSSLPDLVNIPTKIRKKKRRKRRSESEFTSNTPRRAASLTSSKLNLKNNSINNQIVNIIPILRAHCDLTHSTGRRRGICGQSIELSYLDVSLFTLFYFTDIFDNWLLDDGHSKEFPTLRGKQVRAIIKKEILYCLRTSYFCPRQKIEKLHGTMFPSTDPNLFEIGRFLKYFFETVLNVTESTHYTNGISEFIHRLKASGDEKPTTVQNLFQFSMKFSNKEELKMLSIPHPALILSLQRSFKTPYQFVLPSIRLDLTDFVIQLSDDSDDTNYSEIEKSKSSKSESQTRPGSNSPVCRYLRNCCTVIFEYLQNLVLQFPGIFTSADSIDDSWTSQHNSPLTSSLINNADTSRYSWPVSRDFHEDIVSVRSRRKTQAVSVQMDLMAVICLTKERRYTTFVKCGQNPRRGWATWVYFDPLVPLVRKVEDCGKWLLRLEKKPEKIKENWGNIPLDIQNIITTSVLYIYHSKPDYESQNTLISYVNER